MNKQLILSMRDQMVPSDDARAALLDALAQPRRRKRPYARCAVAAAACAALVAVAVLAYQPLHSYVKWNMLMENYQKDALVTAESGMDTGEGDRDQAMTAGELRAAMTGAGFSPTEVEDYLAGGWQMTWAKWWAFLSQSSRRDVSAGFAAGTDAVYLTGEDLVQAITAAGFSQEAAGTCLSEAWSVDAACWNTFLSLGDTSDQALLAFYRTQEALRGTADNGIPFYVVPPAMEALLAFSQAELAVNTGDLSAQEDTGEAVLAYQNLMAYFAQTFPGGYPDWYGGAYIDSHAGLIVLTLGDWEKDFYQQICAWAGSDRIGFGDATYSLNTLRRTQEQAADAMHELGLLIGCGVNEQTNRVELCLNGITREARVILARLDPTDEMIQVYVASDTAAYTPAEEDGVQPGGTLEAPPWSGTTPQPNSVPEEEDPAAIVPQTADYDLLDTDDEDLIADEPIDPNDMPVSNHG